MWVNAQADAQRDRNVSRFGAVIGGMRGVAVQARNQCHTASRRSAPATHITLSTRTDQEGQKVSEKSELEKFEELHSCPSERYDTLVLRNCTQPEVPREACGAEVVAWAAGHALAEAGPLEEFAQAVAAGAFDDCTLKEIVDAAQEAVEKSAKQREQGWIEE